MPLGAAIPSFFQPTSFFCGLGKAPFAQEEIFPDNFALDLIMDHSEVKVSLVAASFSLCD